MEAWELHTHPSPQPQHQLALVSDGEQPGDGLAGRCHKFLHNSILHHIPLLHHLPDCCWDQTHRRGQELKGSKRKAGICAGDIAWFIHSNYETSLRHAGRRFYFFWLHGCALFVVVDQWCYNLMQESPISCTDCSTPLCLLGGWCRMTGLTVTAASTWLNITTNFNHTHYTIYDGSSFSESKSTL